MERRSHLRTVVTEQWGHIHVEDGRRPILCMIVDDSEVGARLKVAAAADVIPPAFDLHIRAGDVRRRCQRVWALGDQLGIWYVPSRSGVSVAQPELHAQL